MGVNLAESLNKFFKSMGAHVTSSIFASHRMADSMAWVSGGVFTSDGGASGSILHPTMNSSVASNIIFFISIVTHDPLRKKTLTESTGVVQAESRISKIFIAIEFRYRFSGSLALF